MEEISISQIGICYEHPDSTINTKTNLLSFCKEYFEYRYLLLDQTSFLLAVPGYTTDSTPYPSPMLNLERLDDGEDFRPPHSPHSTPETANYGHETAGSIRMGIIRIVSVFWGNLYAGGSYLEIRCGRVRIERRRTHTCVCPR